MTEDLVRFRAAVRKARNVLRSCEIHLDDAIDAAGLRQRKAIIDGMVNARECAHLTRSVELALFSIIRKADGCGNLILSASVSPRSNGKDTF